MDCSGSIAHQSVSLVAAWNKRALLSSKVIVLTKTDKRAHSQFFALGQEKANNNRNTGNNNNNNNI